MKRVLLLGLFPLLALALAATPPPAEYAEFHPRIVLRDAAGQSVLAGGTPVSPLATCGSCHDTEYITSHNYHTGASWSEQPGGSLAEAGAEPPAELNCLLCHLAKPDNAARLKELSAGRPDLAATATLAATGLVQRSAAGWAWDAAAFAPDGTVSAAQLLLGSPRSTNCGQCHGQVGVGEQPLALDLSFQNWSTLTTGQVFSAQRLSASALNLHRKDELTRPWDIHAERLLSCTDCHHAPNNPVFRRESWRTKPEHEQFDPRQLRLGSYLQRPNHLLVKGDSAQGLVDPASDNTIRRCVDCHDAERTHRGWLPYVKRHLRVLACEACHVPWVYAPARRTTNWTMLTAAGQPLADFRGAVDGMLDQATVGQPTELLGGYPPALLPRQDVDGARRLYPYNLATTWYWVGDVAGEPRAVSREQLQQALLPNGQYPPALLAALDADGDRALTGAELRLNSAAKVEAAAECLTALGIVNPRIAGELLPFDLHHSVAGREWALRDCTACHAARSRISEPVALGGNAPGGPAPRLSAAPSVRLAGRVAPMEPAGFQYQPTSAAAGLYVLGHDRWVLGDRLGLAAVLLALLIALVHGGLRLALRLRRHAQEVRRP